MNTKKRIFCCRGSDAGGDAIALVRHALGLDFPGAIEFIAGDDAQRQPVANTATVATVAAVDRSDADLRALAAAKRIASEIRPLRGTPGERYFADIRRIDTAAIADVLERTDAIGWHPSVYFNEPSHALHGRRLGCIIGVMTDAISAVPTGTISRTYLDADGRKIWKAKTLGSPAGVVRLSRDEDVLNGLHLAEGIETTLFGLSIGLRPAWSTGSASIMSKFPVLNGIKSLSVIVDHDPSGGGEKAAREVEARWRGAGRETRLFRSDRLGDLNDAIMGTPA